MSDVLDEISHVSPLAQGGADLMGALLGGSRIEQAAKQREELRLLQNQGLQSEVDRKMTEAMLERDKRNSQQRYVDDLVATGVDPITAALQGDTMIGGAANLEQAQAFDLRRRAEQAMLKDPNITAANAALAALDGKPLAQVDIQDGEIIGNRYGAAPSITDTGLTAAKIAAEGARAGMANAHAGVYNAQAAAGGFNPRTGAGAAVTQALDGSYGHPTKAVKEAEAVLADTQQQPELDMTGYDVRDVMHALEGGRRFTPPQHQDASTLRIIEPNRVSFRSTDPRVVGHGAQPAQRHDGAEVARPPAAALARLREGVHTKFGNGQIWTLQGGQPVQVQ